MFFIPKPDSFALSAPIIFKIAESKVGSVPILDRSDVIFFHIGGAITRGDGGHFWRRSFTADPYSDAKRRQRQLRQIGASENSRRVVGTSGFGRVRGGVCGEWMGSVGVFIGVDADGLGANERQKRGRYEEDYGFD